MEEIVYLHGKAQICYQAQRSRDTRHGCKKHQTEHTRRKNEKPNPQISSLHRSIRKFLPLPRYGSDRPPCSNQLENIVHHHSLQPPRQKKKKTSKFFAFRALKDDYDDDDDLA